MLITFNCRDLLEARSSLYQDLKEILKNQCAVIKIDVDDGVKTIKTDTELNIFIQSRNQLINNF